MANNPAGPDHQPARSRLRLRPEGTQVNQALFDRLPALLTAHEAKWVTGLDDHELAEEVRAGRLLTWKPGRVRKGFRGSYKKYVKSSVAVLAGFK